MTCAISVVRNFALSPDTLSPSHFSCAWIHGPFGFSCRAFYSYFYLPAGIICPLKRQHEEIKNYIPIFEFFLWETLLLACLIFIPASAFLKQSHIFCSRWQCVQTETLVGIPLQLNVVRWYGNGIEDVDNGNTVPTMQNSKASSLGVFLLFPAWNLDMKS